MGKGTFSADKVGNPQRQFKMQSTYMQLFIKILLGFKVQASELCNHQTPQH